MDEPDNPTNIKLIVSILPKKGSKIVEASVFYVLK